MELVVADEWQKILEVLIKSLKMEVKTGQMTGLSVACLVDVMDSSGQTAIHY